MRFGGPVDADDVLHSEQMQTEHGTYLLLLEGLALLACTYFLRKYVERSPTFVDERKVSLFLPRLIQTATFAGHGNTGLRA